MHSISNISMGFTNVCEENLNFSPFIVELSIDFIVIFIHDNNKIIDSKRTDVFYSQNTTVYQFLELLGLLNISLQNILIYTVEYWWVSVSGLA